MNIENYKFVLKKEAHVIYLCYLYLEKKLHWEKELTDIFNVFLFEI